MISIIYAVCNSNRGVGLSTSKYGLPWGYVKDESDYFKAYLKYPGLQGSYVVCGKRTYERAERHLRTFVAHIHDGSKDSLETVLSVSKESNGPEVIIIGGMKTYLDFFPYAEEISVSVMTKDYESDIFLPKELPIDSRDLIKLDDKWEIKSYMPSNDFHINLFTKITNHEYYTYDTYKFPSRR